MITVSQICSKTRMQSFTDDSLFRMELHSLTFLPFSGMGVSKLRQLQYFNLQTTQSMPGHTLLFLNTLLTHSLMFKRDLQPLLERVILYASCVKQSDSMF